MATWATLKTQIQSEYDLVAEDFADSTQLLTWVNDGITDIYKEIISIHDKYFETSAPLTLTNGVATVPLPADIFANKITGIYYNDGGSKKYEILPLINLKDVMWALPNDPFRYRIMNALGSNMITLYPTPDITNSTYVTCYYIRKPRTITLDTDVIDIPAAEQFIKQYVVDRAKNKERMTPDAPESAALNRERTLLISTLENMIPDENDDVIANFRLYEEMV